MAPMPEIRPRWLRDRLAFVLFNPELLFHYLPVLECFDPEEVDLLLYPMKHPKELIRRAIELPFDWYLAKDLIYQRTGYRYLVSNHGYAYQDLSVKLADGSQAQYRGSLLRLLGKHQIRFMYAQGMDWANLADWNALYDAFLCFGPLQARQLGHFDGIKLQMGYPRYDACFNAPLSQSERADWLARLNCDPSLPVLVWFSTLPSFFGVMDLFAPLLAPLQRDYNLILKPHPDSGLEDPGFTARLDALGFKSVIRERFDNAVLLQLADYVLTDYGGTAYSSLYLDKPLLLLDHPDYPHGRAAFDLDSWLREKILHLNAAQAQRLPAILADQAYWREQKQIRTGLRRELFSPNYGHSARTAADFLRRLPQLLKTEQP